MVEKGSVGIYLSERNDWGGHTHIHKHRKKHTEIHTETNTHANTHVHTHAHTQTHRDIMHPVIALTKMNSRP